jgi:hypothetical protein
VVVVVVVGVVAACVRCVGVVWWLCGVVDVCVCVRWCVVVACVGGFGCCVGVDWS